MASLKYTSIEKILQQYNFENETAANKDLTCTICKKILRNAHNGPCGCRYCLDCITKYLGDNEKFCPGKFDECQDQEMKVQNILTDQAANTRISRLLVKCPEPICDFKDELKKIEEHIRVCNIGPRKCPYFDFGCIHDKICRAEMNEHLADENYSHAIMMIDWMQNLKNEVASVNENLEIWKPIKDELQSVKNELQRNKVAMRALQYKMNTIMIRQNESNAMGSVISDSIPADSDSDRSVTSPVSLGDVSLSQFEGSVRHIRRGGRFRGRSRNRGSRGNVNRRGGLNEYRPMNFNRDSP